MDDLRFIFSILTGYTLVWFVAYRFMKAERPASVRYHPMPIETTTTGERARGEKSFEIARGRQFGIARAGFFSLVIVGYVVLGLALTLTGCRENENLSPGFHRAGSKEFSADEAKAVGVAKAELEKEDRKRIDARYKITRVPEGFSVHVNYVTGYDHGQPIFIPGGF